MHLLVFYIVALTITVLLCMNLVVIVMLWQHSTMTRILALDTLGSILIALLALYANAYRAAYYLDVAIMLTLLAFVGTLAAAQYHSVRRLFSASFLPPDLFVNLGWPWREVPPWLHTLLPWIADALVLTGVGIMSIAIYGMLWLPDVYTRLHAASKVSVLGVIPILLASLTTGEPALIFRSLLIIPFLLLTIPVSSHAIARAARLSGEPTMEG